MRACEAHHCMVSHGPGLQLAHTLPAKWILAVLPDMHLVYVCRAYRAAEP